MKVFIEFPKDSPEFIEQDIKDIKEALIPLLQAQNYSINGMNYEVPYSSEESFNINHYINALVNDNLITVGRTTAGAIVYNNGVPERPIKLNPWLQFGRDLAKAVKKNERR